MHSLRIREVFIMNPFQATTILIPKVESFHKWSVIACDQFTSQPEYWERVRENVKNEYSAFHLIFPEAYLSDSNENAESINLINRKMDQYIREDIWNAYENSYVYVERTLQSGQVRKGLVGVIDLEQYSYEKDAETPIRATEKTIVERIPPRKMIRQDALVELPHILLLCDDDDNLLIEPLEHFRDQLPLLYDFELMENGGRVAGWLIQGAMAKIVDDQFDRYVHRCTEKYKDLNKAPVMFAVGDGNHSLATAKACYEEWKENHPKSEWEDHPSRYALVELENLYDDVQQFEPIHRLITNLDVNHMMDKMKEEGIIAKEGYPIQWFSHNSQGILYLNQEKGHLPVAILENFWKEYFKNNEGVIDYIHGDQVLEELSRQENTIGFLMPVIEKNQLFSGIMKGGVYPRKTFSIGHAQDKRYYLEARKIK